MVIATADRKRMRDDCIAAVTAITKDREMAEASHRWWRQTQTEVAKHRDGLNLDGLGLGTMARWFANIPDSVTVDKANGYWIDAIRERQTTGAGYFVLASRDRTSIVEQLAAGRILQRILLYFTHHGVDAQPLNMLPELQDREATTQAAQRPYTERATHWVGSDGMQLIVRFGYSDQRGYHAARRGLAEVSI